jgi:hypothetical protein
MMTTNVYIISTEMTDSFTIKQYQIDFRSHLKLGLLRQLQKVDIPILISAPESGDGKQLEMTIRAVRARKHCMVTAYVWMVVDINATSSHSAEHKNNRRVLR